MTYPIDVPRVEYRNISGKPFKFIVESLGRQYVYLCSVDDVANILRAEPQCDSEGLELFVFHQPKMGEKAGCCWGRYAAEYPYQGEYRRAVILDAVENRPQLSSVKLADRTAEQEAECLREDGHKVVLLSGRYFISSSQEAIRRTQLYRGVYHLIYHHIEMTRGIREEPDRERAANRYAREMKQKWLADMLRYD
jgi:hypothetical protein